MIDQLRTKVDEAAIPVVVGDMATAAAPGEFTLVYLVFNTISNLLTQAEQVACFRNAARHLPPGGRFVIELWVPELRRLPPGPAGHGLARRARLHRPGHLRRRCTSRSSRTTSVSATAGRRSSSAARTATSGRPSSTSWRSSPDSTWRARHADWAGAEFTADSRSHVSVYRLTEW